MSGRYNRTPKCVRSKRKQESSSNPEGQSRSPKKTFRRTKRWTQVERNMYCRAARRAVIESSSEDEIGENNAFETQQNPDRCEDDCIIDDDLGDVAVARETDSSDVQDMADVSDNECRVSECSDETDTPDSYSSDSASSSSASIGNFEEFEEEETDVFSRRLYRGSCLTVGASCTIIIQYIRKYSIPRKAVGDLLKLLSLHLPDDADSDLPRSFEELIKAAVPVVGKAKKYKACSVCNTNVGSKDLECEHGHPQHQEITTGPKLETFFLHLPLEPQLHMIIRDHHAAIVDSPIRPGVACHARRGRGDLRDITDGTLYKKHQLQLNGDRDTDQGTQEHVITLMMNTDGAPVFKSSKCSVWPLYACVIELPLSIRYTSKNIMLLGLWYGPKKPDINVFLKPTLGELGKLKEQGMLHQTANGLLKFRGNLHCFVCDLPGKSMALLHILYNGKFGCMNCEHPGKRLAVPGNVRVYPHGVEHQTRTVQKTRLYAMLAARSNVPIYGLKGYSTLHDFMDIPNGSPIDYMHCVLEGTTRRILQGMLDSKNKDQPYYIKPQTRRNIDQILEGIFVPHDMERKPRTTDHLSYWKATEIQHFLLYFGLPVLKGTIPAEYFHHLALLVTAMWIMLKGKITQREVALAGSLLKSFCRLMKSLYGERSETMNVHNLSHLEDQVKCLGPLWTHSCFAFEAMIAHLLRTFNGTRGVADQMVINYFIDKEVYPLRRRLEQDKETCNDVKDFSADLTLSKPRSNWYHASDGVMFSLPSITKGLNCHEAQAVNRLFGERMAVDTDTQCSVAERISRNDIVFHSKTYKRRGKSCSFLVQYAEAQECMYGEVQVFILVHGHALAIIKPFIQIVTTICKSNIECPSDAVVNQFVNGNILGSHHIPVECLPPHELKAIFCSTIISKCILVKASREQNIYAYLTPMTDINLK